MLQLLEELQIKRTVVLTIPGTSAESGNAQIVVSSSAFTNRIISSTLAERTSDSVAYSFEGLAGTTVSIGDGVIDAASRSISWEATFSNIGEGLTRNDIVPTPDLARVDISGGSGSDKRIIKLTIPGLDPVNGTASFVINENAFFDRTITSALAERTSNSVDYSFLVKGIPVSPNIVRRPSVINTAIEGDWRVFLNNLEITKYTDQVENISYTLDYDEPYSFKIAEATIVLTNENGEFSSLNPDNLFSDVGYDYGFRCPVTIFSGNEFVFYGNVLEVYHNEEQGTVRLNLADLSSDLNNKDVIDLGIEKRIRLDAYDRQESSDFGIYPFPIAVATAF